jgi:hypothetical protein
MPGDNPLVDGNAPRWSSEVGQADWIARRLTSWDGGHVVTKVIPAGFEAYARVLHPVDTPENGGDLVRWADMAAWSGLPLRPDAQFHSVALPPADPGGSPPGDGASPWEGSLYTGDAAALASIAREWTSTPQDCWFCVWDGYGWDAVSTSVLLATDGEPPPEVVAAPPRDPVPQPVRDGPHVLLPHREYLLYQGPAEDVVASASLHGTWGQCANLWWPADHAWCVASEIDLPWTYVGGQRGLIDAILADDRIEALPAAPDDPVSRVEDWVSGWVNELADGLLSRGEASVTTSRGTIEARLRRPRRLRAGALFIRAERHDGSAGSTGDTTITADEDLRESVTLYLTLAVIGIAGM